MMEKGDTNPNPRKSFTVVHNSVTVESKNFFFIRIIFSKFYSRKNVMLALDPIVHENWGSPKPNSNDIALLKLAEDVDLATYTPACLPASGADYTGQNGRVYGGSSFS